MLRVSKHSVPFFSNLLVEGFEKMTMLRPEDHERLAMELVTFAKDELQRRKKAPILIPREEIDAQLKDARFPVHMVDPRIGSNQKTFRFSKLDIAAARTPSGKASDIATL